MGPDARFIAQPKDFWAHVRTLSQKIGYKDRKADRIRVLTLGECIEALTNLQLRVDHVLRKNGTPTPFAELLLSYFEYRATVLNDFVESHLMNVAEARRTFSRLKKELKPSCPLPMNKQTEEKRAPAYLTCIVNMLIESNSRGMPCNYDPQQLTTVTRHGVPLRTLARRVDGAFPSPVNPVAVWEMKEYYYSTSFGSRVADGVYESLLDGMELEELREHEEVDVKHYLVIDAHDNWWKNGKSYLCRIVDMLHMGYVDEALFGREVLDRLPKLVSEWVTLARKQTEPTPETA